MNSIKNLQFKDYQNIHIIGIGGIGISALARILLQQGHKVSGSDLNQSALTDTLIQEGMSIKIGHDHKNLDPQTNLVIFSNAIPTNNPERTLADDLNIPTITYPQAVGILTRNFQTICIAGTHGKTTTTSMIGLSLLNNQQDPTIIVGSLLKELGNKNEHIGRSDLFVLESCEYQESFLNYSPTILVLNNVEAEHLDFFKTEENYLNVFRKFIAELKPNGVIIANGDDLNIRLLIKEIEPSVKVITFGQNKDNDYQIQKNKIIHQGQAIDINLSLPGLHNLFNATACLAVSDYLKLNQRITIQTLEKFQGAARRFEIKGKIGQTVIIDDYGHAPTEIQATLQAVKEKYGSDSKVLTVFQPHQYSRTHQFLNEFANSFNQSNKVYIPSIYKTRDTEEDLQKVSPQKLVDAINNVSANKAEHTENFEKTIERAKQYLHDFDVILTIGAGDIYKVSDQLILL